MDALMSGRMVGEIFQWAPRDLTVTQRLVLISLAERAFDGDRLSRKSARLIADECGLGVSTVHHVLGELARRGLILRKITQTGPRRTQVYYLPPLSPEHLSRGQRGRPPRGGSSPAP